MTAKKGKQLEWDISSLQDLAVALTIFPKLPSNLPIVRYGKKGAYRYFIDERRLPKELMTELVEFLHMISPSRDGAPPDRLGSVSIEIAEDCFFTHIAPLFKH